MSEAPTRHLGDVASFVRGITFKPGDVVPVGSPGSVACMRTKNVQSALDLSDVWGIPESFVKRAEQYILTGDLLVSSANSWNLVGKCCRVPQLQWPATFGGFISVLRGDPSQIEARYLYYWFSSPRIQATVRSFGQQTTNISNLNVDRCRRLCLPLPSLPEQRRIAAILDKADALQAKRRAALAHLDTFTQSIFLDMFGDPATNPKGWPYSRLGDVTDFYAGSTLPAGDAFDGQADGYFLLKVSDMNLAGNEVYLESCQQWSAEPGAASSTCPAASIVIPKRGGAIGTNKKRIAVRPSVLDPNLMAIWPRPDLIELSFLYSWLLRLDLDSITSGSSVPQLNKRDLDPLSIPVPPLEAQREFSRKFGAMEGVIMLHDRALSVCDTLFAALQHGAFQGEL